MSSRYEERLVELHSVIAELSRQIEEKSRERIAEEEDESDDESRHKEVDESERRHRNVDESRYKNVDESERRYKNVDENERQRKEVDEIASRSDVGSRTSTDIDAQAVEVEIYLFDILFDFLEELYTCLKFYLFQLIFQLFISTFI